MDDRFEREIYTELLTKYINHSLRNDGRIVDWAFYMESKDILVVRIDYLGDFHSSDMIMITKPYDYDALKEEFNYYFDRHLKEWDKLMRGDKNE